MNWEALGATAGLLGAIGVLASLIYLGLQIRQNTAWLRQQSFQLSTNEIRQWALQFSGSRSNAELFPNVQCFVSGPGQLSGNQGRERIVDEQPHVPIRGSSRSRTASEANRRVSEISSFSKSG